MAESKVKKGFFFYLMIFFILILAFVGVCVTIMLLNPGKNVLGFQYFSNNTTKVFVSTTDSTETNNTELGLTTVKYSTIDIDAGAADVILQNNTDYKKDAVIIINKSKGFSQSSNTQEFDYSILVEENGTEKNLKIQLAATYGFLNFSKDIKVIINLAGAKTDEEINAIKNANLKVRTTAGNVLIGGNRNTGYSWDIFPKSLDIETGSGSITLSEHANNIYESINLKTESGNINIASKDNLSATSADVKIDAGSGTFRAKTINDNLVLASSGATIEVEEIVGNLNASLASGIVNISKVSGNANFEEGSEVMNSCKLTIDEIKGFLNIPQGRDSDITVKNISGAINVHTTGGSVTLGSDENLIKTNTYVETTSGSINVNFGASLFSRFLLSEKGTITANFPEAPIGTKNTIFSKDGNVNVNFLTESKIKFVFEMPNEDTEDDASFDLSKVNFDILNGRTLESNPYYYNCTEATSSATINLITNKTITLDLI